jgi:hypothetical protein
VVELVGWGPDPDIVEPDPVVNPDSDIVDPKIVPTFIYYLYIFI